MVAGNQSLGSATGEIIISAAGVRRGVEDAKREFRSGLDEIGSQVSEFGSNMTNLGGSMVALTAPLVAGFAAGVNAATNFEESMSNIQAVTGDTAEQTAALGETLQTIGENSRFGGQAIAEAYYDVAGGVADASVRMDILNNAISLAQAGNTDLSSATQAMIAVMNSYGFSAEQAGMVSDVLTRTVGMGVGTMGDFAAAMPLVTGQANSLGIGLDHVGTMMAYMTTKGFSASQAATQLRAMMQSLMAPNNAMLDALHALGYENGQAALETNTLMGVFQELVNAGYGDQMAAMAGSSEALNGILAMTGENAETYIEFFDQYADGIEGVTAAAENIQMASPAAQFDLLRSTISSLAIDIGQALLPTLVEIVQAIRPVVQSIINWVRQNPGLIRTIAMIVGGVAGLGAILMPLGGIISAIGGAIGLLANPFAWIAAAIAAFGAAFETNFMGIRDAVQPVIEGIISFIQGFISWINMGAEPLQAFRMAFGMAFSGETAVVVGSFVESVITGIGGIISFITGTVLPGLQSLVSWFITDGLPLAVNFVTGVVVPGLTNFVTFLGNVWATVSPGLFMLADWFINTALPAILTFITDMVVPGFEAFIGLIMGIWDAVSPTLLSLLDWFTVSALPSIVAFMTDTVGPTIQSITDFITGIWTLGSVALQALADWWSSDTLTSAIGGVSDVVEAFQTVLSGIWNAVQPVLQPILDFFNNLLAPVREVINAISSLGGAVNGSGNNYMTTPTGVDVGVGTLSGFGGSRDSGGPVRANIPYYIGTGAQPELFIPETAGTMVPANQQNNYNSGSSDTYNLTINANSYAEGQAAAAGLRDGLEAERRRRG